jgi:hypothetical protein
MDSHIEKSENRNRQIEAVIYDQFGLGWHAIHDGSDETNSVCVMRIAVDK